MGTLTSNHIMSIDKQPIFNDVLQTPYKMLSTADDKDFGLIHSNVDYDALQAVKMDPAVLEAQVTVTQSAPTQNTNHNTTPTTPNNFVTQSAKIQNMFHNPTPPTHNNSGTRVDTKERKDVMQSGIFEAAVSMQQAALFSLTPDQFNLLLTYVDTLRKQRHSLQKQMECAFCKKNGQPEVWYTTHALRDTRGRVRCPVLRAHCCRRCGATGDNAHTVRYCRSTTRMSKIPTSNTTFNFN